MRGVPLLLALQASGCGCGSEGGKKHGDADADTDSDTDVDVPTPCAPAIEVLSIDRVLDPKLAGEPGTELALDLTETGNPPAGTTYNLEILVRSASGEVVVTLDDQEVSPGARTVLWDGKGAGGAFADPGRYTVSGTFSCEDGDATFEEAVDVVRLGVAEIRLLAGTGQRLPLLYHRFAGVRGNLWPIPLDEPDAVRGSDVAGESALDLPDGSPRPWDAPWADLDSPPIDPGGGPERDHFNQPVAIAAGGLTDVEIVLGADAVTAAGASVPVGWPIAEHPIRPRPEGWSYVADQAGVSPGEAAILRSDAGVASAVGKVSLVLRSQFEYQDGAEWLPVRGHEESTHTVYALLGESTVMTGRGDEEPYMAWVAVADAVAAKVAGSSAVENDVLGDVVHLIFEDEGLRYDTAAGASFYTQYPGWDFSGASLDLVAYMDRDNGSVVNCSDCASLVSVYANMVGCDIRYNIIGYNFPLSYIRAIGGDAFSNDPFRTGAPGGFSYHAVTSPDGAGTVFDATLALDADDDPDSAPFEERIVDGVDGDFYLDHLSPGNPGYEYDEKTDID